MQADLEGGSRCMKGLLDPVTSCHPMSSAIAMTRKMGQGVGYVRLWRRQSRSTPWGHRMAARSWRHCRMGEVMALYVCMGVYRVQEGGESGIFLVW